MTLFVGLGNPGASYSKNRHNIGFRVIDRLIDHYGARNVSKNTFEGELFKSNQLLFLKPTTYMNLSGKSVFAVMQFYKILLEDMIVIHDDLDLPFGAVRFKKGGGNGGHNGLKSLDHLIGNDYLRVRLGIGKPAHRSQVADYVLSDFTPDESAALPSWIGYIADSCDMLASDDGLDEVKSKRSIKSMESLVL